MSSTSTAASAAAVIVQVERRPGGYAILTLCKEPVNSLDLEAWKQLEAALDDLEADPSVSGLIIASGLAKDVFSAGNDLLELYAPKTTKERYSEFWILQNRLLAKLYRSRLATVAAIRGASPAGGCIIAMACDHRVMTDRGTIGLNEVALGIPVPRYWGMLMQRLIGVQASDKLLLTGRLATSAEAKALGLVDELVPWSPSSSSSSASSGAGGGGGGREGLMAAAEARMLKLVMLPASAVAATKASLRGAFCAEWEAFSKVEPLTAWPFLQQEDTTRIVGEAIRRLSGGKKQQQQPQGGAGGEGMRKGPSPISKL